MPTKASEPRGGFVLQVLPALLYLVGIFVGGSLPQPPETGLEFEYQDKVLHLLAFGGLQYFGWRAVRYAWPAAASHRQIWGACLASSGAGALLEFWQAALPTRQAELMDWVADTLGALLMALWLWRARAAAAAR